MGVGVWVLRLTRTLFFMNWQALKGNMKQFQRIRGSCRKRQDDYSQKTRLKQIYAGLKLLPKVYKKNTLPE